MYHEPRVVKRYIVTKLFDDTANDLYLKMRYDKEDHWFNTETHFYKSNSLEILIYGNNLDNPYNNWLLTKNTENQQILEDLKKMENYELISEFYYLI